MKENQDLIQTIIEGIQEKKGKQIVTADLSEIESSSAQYFIICQGGSPAQVAAIADSVRETTLQKIGVKPFNYDGYKNCYRLRSYLCTYLPTRTEEIL